MGRTSPPRNPRSASRREGSFPAAAKRRPDLRADRRDPQKPSRHRENANAERPAKASQSTRMNACISRPVRPAPARNASAVTEKKNTPGNDAWRPLTGEYYDELRPLPGPAAGTPVRSFGAG